MLNHKTIIIITAFCSVSLAGAEKKEGESKIEPKLVYEKRFDFEIEQGKIGDDGSIFPTIFVTKDDRVLFYDDRGRTVRSIKLNEREAGTLSEDGKYLIIQNIPKDWWKEGTEKKWQVFDRLGKIIAKGSYKEPYAVRLQILEDPLRIILYGCTTEKMMDIRFLDESGHLLSACVIDSLITEIIGTSTHSAWVQTQGANSVNKYIIGAITDIRPVGIEKNKAWVVIFNENGKVTWKREVNHYNIFNIAVSADGKYIVYTTEPSKNQYLVLIECATGVTREYKLETHIWKDRSILSTNPRFSSDSKWFYYLSHFNIFYLFNIEQIIRMPHNSLPLKWYGPPGYSITRAFISEGEPLYISIEIGNKELVLLSSENKEVFKIKNTHPIIDVKIDTAERKLYILSKNSVKIYQW